LESGCKDNHILGIRKHLEKKVCFIPFSPRPGFPLARACIAREKKKR
jgi:hypothetical protein